MHNDKEKKDILNNLKQLLDLKVIDQDEYEAKIKKLNQDQIHFEQNSEITNKPFINQIKSTQTNDVLVEVRNFTKQYDRKSKPAVENISFQIRKGQFHAFIGANGAGKTTTMKALVGAYAKWDGEIKINGISNQEAAAKAKIGYVPEQALFPKFFKAKEYLQIMAELSGLNVDEAKQFAENKLVEFNMQKLANISPQKFSSGQKKKILCAQALCHNPEILILDEPAANLDPKARIELFDLLKKVQADGKAIFISSHILAELDRYADYATILDGGKIVYSGPINKGEDLEKLYNKYVVIGSVHTAKNK